MSRALLRASMVFGVLLGSVLAPAYGQGYPNKPIHLVVPFAPGGGTDISARAISGELGRGLGQPVLVENRPGASSHLGSKAVAQAPADGYTLLLTSIGTVVVSPHVQKLDYDPVKELAPVAQVGASNLAIGVNAATPIRSVADLVKFSKDTPQGIFYSVSALGTMPHLAAELFKAVTGTNWNPVNYKGAGPAGAALVSGEVPATLIDLTTLLPHLAGGRIRVIAVTSAKRSFAAPQIPTVAESGYPGYVADAWVGIFAPAATPADIVNKLNAEINRAMNTPDVTKTLAKTGTEPANMTAEQFRRQVAEDYAKWGKVIRGANIKLE